MGKTRRLLRRSIGLMVLTLGACALFAAPAWAHATLVSSLPAAGAVVASPQLIQLTFSEASDPAASQIQLRDAAGKPVPGVSRPLEVPGDDKRLDVALSAVLPDGSYTVAWRSVALDGHAEEGSFGFRVAAGAPPASPPASPSAVAPSTGHGASHGGALQPPASTPGWVEALQGVGRYALYIGLILLVGGAATCWLVFKGVLVAESHALVRSATLIAAVGVILMTYAEARILGAPSLEPLWRTAAGGKLLQLGVAVWAGCGLALLVFELAPSRWTIAIVGAMAAVAMLVRVLGGHADTGSMPLVAVPVQWVHMAAVGVWVGGLPWLLLGIRGHDRAFRAGAVARFSAVAGIGIAVVVLTGLLRAVNEIGSPSELFTTSYGLTLVAKVAVVALIAALGALNRYRLVPALARDDEAARPFRRAAGGEVVVGAIILVVVAVLTGLAPPVG